MTYTDAFVAPVPKDKLDDYFVIAAKMAPLWKAHGVLRVVEARPDDVPVGEITSFPRAVQCGPDELPVFGFMTYRDRAHRDAVLEAAMADPEIIKLMMEAPMDGKRMIFGGFTAETDA